MAVIEAFLAVVNPAAGGGKCGKLAGPALSRLRAQGKSIDAVETASPGDAIRLVRQGYQQGYRKFIAVGGDGTAYEMVNGFFPEALMGERPTLGFLPLGTGNSFLRDFSERGADRATEAMIFQRVRPCDVFRLQHAEGVLHYINLMSLGFTADVAALTNRRFKRLGELGYLLSVFICLVRLNRKVFPLRADEDRDFDRRRCLFIALSNSRFTGGKMMIAPAADVSDGLIEYVHWGPIGRVGLLLNLHTLFDGSHINHRLASRRAVRQIEFDLARPVDVMIDGEVLTLTCERLDVLPGAIHVFV